MDPFKKVEVGTTGLCVTRLGLGARGIVDPTAAGGWLWDFSREGVRRSLESSLERLGVSAVDILFLHSPDNHYDQAMSEAYRELVEMRANGVILGGPYNSGILASDLGPGALYDYRAAPPQVLQQAVRIKEVCDRHAVPLKAAALQFVLAHPAVTSVIPGSSYPEHVLENAAMVRYGIPATLWEELRHEGLISEDASLPH